MFALVAGAMVAIAGPVPDIARNNASLELDVRVIEAFEHGPVIIEVSVTNRGKKPLRVNRVRGPWPTSIILAPEPWKMRRLQVLCAGSGASGDVDFQHGETWTEVHRLHQEFISRFPAGDYEITVYWPMWSLAGPQRNPSRLIAAPSKTVPVTVTPATPQDLWFLAGRLQAEFAAIPPSKPEAVYSILDKVVATPHKELIPLALQLIDRGYDCSRQNSGTGASLVWTVFNADPESAHRIFVDRLLADPPRVDPDAVFRVWEEAELNLLGRWRQVIEFVMHTYNWRSTDGRVWLDIAAAICEHVSESACRAKEMRFQRLPDAELRRLATAKDPEVRKLVEQTFGGRLKR
jgi:hypothetical protein